MKISLNWGYLGSFFLAICGLFEAERAIFSDKYDISTLFVLSWFIGEVCMLKAVWKDAPLGYLLFNYGVNILFILVILGRLVWDLF